MTIFGLFCVIVLSLFSSAIGPVPSPFDCYLANRGLKTLHLRMRQHQVNATAVARFLEKNPRVERVIYPGKTTGVCMPYYDTGYNVGERLTEMGHTSPYEDVLV